MAAMSYEDTDNAWWMFQFVAGLAMLMFVNLLYHLSVYVRITIDKEGINGPLDSAVTMFMPLRSVIRGSIKFQVKMHEAMGADTMVNGDEEEEKEE
jgi:hypothetical protein